MTIELIGDADAIQTLAPEKTDAIVHSDRSERHGSHVRFATVAIPDIRHQDFVKRSKTDEVPAAADELLNSQSHPPRRGHTLTSLATIKESIESSLIAAGNSNEVETQQLVQEISSGLHDLESKNDLAHTSGVSGNHEGSDRLVRTNKPLKSIDDCLLAKLNPNDPQIEPIAETILSKYPIGGTAVIAFSRSEPNEQLETTVAHAAVALQSHAKCKILVIDAELSSQRLTELVCGATTAGLSEVASSGDSWGQLLETTSFETIDFLSGGQTTVHTIEKLDSILKKTIPNFTGSYDYVLVNVGDAHEEFARVWADYTHGTFLLVSMTDANRDIAKSAVAQLNNFGARLIGCIMSDSDV